MQLTVLFGINSTVMLLSVSISCISTLIKAHASTISLGNATGGIE